MKGSLHNNFVFKHTTLQSQLHHLYHDWPINEMAYHPQYLVMDYSFIDNHLDTRYQLPRLLVCYSLTLMWQISLRSYCARYPPVASYVFVLAPRMVRKSFVGGTGHPGCENNDKK